MAPVGDAVEVGSTGIAAGDRGRLVVGEEGMSREDGWREGVACCVVWYGTLQRWQNAALRLLSIVREYGILPSTRSIAESCMVVLYHTNGRGALSAAGEGSPRKNRGKK